jgi:hypothetical protein
MEQFESSKNCSAWFAGLFTAELVEPIGQVGLRFLLHFLAHHPAVSSGGQNKRDGDTVA